jgi:putative ABC transport system permease protein
VLEAFQRLLRQSIRGHLRQPGFAVLVMVTLALGIAAATVICGVWYTVQVNPFPFPDGDRLTMLSSSQPERSAFRLAVSYPDFEDWRQAVSADAGASQPLFEEMALVSNSRPVILTGEAPEHLTAELISFNYFDILGVETAVGRLFRAEEDEVPSRQPVVLLSYPFWQRRYAGDPAIVGQKILLNGSPYEVVGVISQNYRGTWWDPIDIWVPSMMVPDVIGPNYVVNRKDRWCTVLGKLAPGVSIEAASEALDRVAERLEAAYPDTNQGYRVKVYPLIDVYYDYILPDLRKALWGSGFLLLLCCLNVGGLLLTRGTLRRQDMAVRAALGASRRRLFGRELADALLLALGGGVLGILLSLATAGWLVNLSTIPTMHTVVRLFHPWVLTVSLALALGAGVLFGALPAAQVFGADLWRFLRSGGKSSSSRGLRRLLAALVVGELALAVVLLLVAGLALQDFFQLRRAEVGFRTDDVLTLRLDLTSERFTEPGARQRFVQDLLDRTRQMPGVQGAGLVGPYSPPNVVLYTDLTIEDRLIESTEGASFRSYREYISPGYLAAMDIGLVAGRDFSRQDGLGQPLVAIVSEALAERAWPEGNPLGKRVHRGLPESEDPWVTVVGVAETVKNRGARDLGKGPDIDIYFPLYQEPPATATLMVHAQQASSLAEPVRRLMRDLSDDVPAYQLRTMEEEMIENTRDEYFVGVVLALFAVFALAVTVVGVYGVLAYGVRQRTRELGIRQALGANRWNILCLVVGQGMALVVAGCVLGLALAWVLSHYHVAVSAGLGVVGWVTWVGVLASLALLSLVAVLVSGFAATRVQPTEAMVGD